MLACKCEQYAKAKEILLCEDQKRQIIMAQYLQYMMIKNRQSLPDIISTCEISC